MTQRFKIVSLSGNCVGTHLSFKQSLRSAARFGKGTKVTTIDTRRPKDRQVYTIVDPTAVIYWIDNGNWPQDRNTFPAITMHTEEIE